MKKQVVILIYIFSIAIGYAKMPVPIITKQEDLTIENLISIIRKSQDAVIRKEMVALIQKKANLGDNSAMNALGILYAQGVAVNKDLPLSLEWFEKAYNHGSKRAAYNLAMMYRRGVSVPQDFSKSFDLLEKSFDTSQPQTVYAQGYFWYKGFGCKQDYTKALELFRIAADAGHGYAMYMLGLCYRNGYGVERDMSEANLWLCKAAQKNVSLSNDELQADDPENPILPVRLKSLSTRALQESPVQFNRVKHELSPTNLGEGDYSGTLVTYDWSGKYAVREKSLAVNVKRNGDKVFLQWKEDDATTVNIEGILADTALVFQHASYCKKDHYHREEPVMWNFVQANLRAAVHGKETTISGNLQLYSPDTKEPEKPMYLTLKNNTVVTELKSEKQDKVSVYPNPFIDAVNISFSLDEEGPCSIEVLDIKGMAVFHKDLGILSIGEQHFQFSLDVSAGNYVIKLKYGNKIYTAILIKESN